MKEYYKDVSVVLRGVTIEGDVIYLLTEDNAVRYIRIIPNPMSPANNSFKGFGIEFKMQTDMLF